MTGYALATALAAPVDDGMMLAEAARPARQSPFIEPSTVSCDAVAARPVVVHDAHDNRHRRLVLVLVDANHQGRGLGV